MNKKAIIALAVLVVVVGGGIFWMVRQEPAANDNNTAIEPTSSPSSDTSTTGTDSPTDAPAATETTITYSGSGFSPSTITVKTGDTVVIKNTSTRNVQFDSDPHPAHTTNPELNVNDVAPGESRSFVVNTKGTFGYHNHLNASQKGTIIVE